MTKKHKSFFAGVLHNPSLLEYVKVTVVLLLFLAVSASNSDITASLVKQRDIARIPAFDGTVLPLRHSLNWSSLTAQESKDFRTGTLSFESAGNKLQPIMAYDAQKLCDNQPGTPKWQELSKPTKNMFLTYVTAYNGKYSAGSEKACQGDGSHPGVDIRAPKGTPISAIANGMVLKAQYSSGSGNHVCILHPNVPSLEDPTKKDNYVSCYLHMDKIDPTIKEGSIVVKGDTIGYVGKTGLSTTYHLHFQIDKTTAPFYPYWPFTNADAKKAGLDYVEAVDFGLNKDNVAKFTVNPMEWVQQNKAKNGKEQNPS